MLNVPQIIGFLLAGFSVLFMLWFLTNLIRESYAEYRRHARRPLSDIDSWPARTFSPRAPSSSARVPHNPDRGALRPMPQFGQSSRSLHSASR
jgi:hypothetical protein